MKNTKYIFVTGGVVSGLGKGVASASLAVLLKSHGFTVTIQKFDPYLNIDPGTMSPYQHGEVFVTEDGCETDLDLGHYERFIGENLTGLNNLTSGMIYWKVLNKERNGDYLGKTIQTIPHITNEIRDRISVYDGKYDFIITEIGGTVGDIESQPFVEAIRRFEYMYQSKSLHIHLTLVPYLKSSGEFKTKPTQHSVKTLMESGIHPDILICRSEDKLGEELRDKIALFCDVEARAVINGVDVNSIYEVPLNFAKENLDIIVLEKLGYNESSDISPEERNLDYWKNFVDTMNSPLYNTAKIAIVGKYVELSDAYISIVEALKHAGVAVLCNVEIKWVHAEFLTEANIEEQLSDVDGILVPGGFGDRGIEGKILAAKYARENCKTYLGLCLGMHIAVIEFARNVLGWEDANSTEFDKETKHPVIDYLPDQSETISKGGTMRLGNYQCRVKNNTLLHSAYSKDIINERHRHRYEFNNLYRSQFEEAGMVMSGTTINDALVEVVEIPSGAWFLACQFHPEFKSRPYDAHPLFMSFIAKSLK